MGSAVPVYSPAGIETVQVELSVPTFRKGRFSQEHGGWDGRDRMKSVRKYL